jgi:hypothetical protein
MRLSGKNDSTQATI